MINMVFSMLHQFVGECFETSRIAQTRDYEETITNLENNYYDVPKPFD